MNRTVSMFEVHDAGRAPWRATVAVLVAAVSAMAGTPTMAAEPAQVGPTVTVTASRDATTPS